MAAPASDIDLFSDEVLVDPYPAYAALRELGGVVHLPANGVYALTRHATIRGALGDPMSFSSRSIGFNPAVNQALAGTSLASDPPAHTELRATLSQNLTPRALRGLKDEIEAEADRLVGNLIAQGTFEAIDELCRVFPLSVVGDLIGFQGHVRDNMVRWGKAANMVIGPLNRRTEENFPIAGELYEWCSTVTAHDLAPGSVGRGIFDAEARGAIPAGSAGHIIHQYLAAGLENTVSSIGNIVALFGRYPDQFGLVRKGTATASSAFNEVLRFWAPIHAWGRLATRDIEMDGTTIPAGAQIAVLFGAGNRDERHYEDPDTFLVERNPVDHLSFGYGPHGCAGQGLARLEGHAIIEALARRARSFRIGDVVRRPANVTVAIDELQVVEVVPA